MKERTLNVELRTEIGKNNCHRLRKSGYLPAVLYSHGTSELIKVSTKDFTRQFSGHISESVLIDLNITNKTEDSIHKAFVKDYQLDPVTDEILHLDFYKITLGEKIRTMVPFEAIGTATGVRKGGILEIIERELEVECLPTDLPENFEFDITNLQIGDSIYIKDLQVSDSIKFLSSPDRIIATVLAPHIAKKEEEIAVEAEEGEEEIETAEKEPTEDKPTGKE